MKKLLLGLSLITIALFISCKEEEKEKVIAQFQEIESTIVAEGGTVDLVLELNGADTETYPYTASIEGDGFSITNTGGDLAVAGQTFTVTATPNVGSAPAERSGTLTVNIPSLDQTLTATITQIGNIVTAKFKVAEATIDGTGGTADLVLELTGAGSITYPYTVSIAGDGFFTTNTGGDLATAGETFTVTATSNPAQTERTGTLTVNVVDLGLTLTATITQTGSLLLNTTQYNRDKGEAGKANRANSYIIPLEKDSHKLSIERIDDYWAGTDPLYGGNNAANTIAANSDLIIEVLWADFDFADKVSVSVDISDKSMTLDVKDLPSLGGNMVVVATKADGTTVLWNWHIWFSDIVTGTDQISTELPSGQKIMDRNLGAKSFNGPDTETFGLLFQWGRKDPFPGSASASTMAGADHIIYTPDGEGICMTPGFGSFTKNGSIALSIANPFTYYTSTQVEDWVRTGVDANAKNSRRWNSSANSLEKGTKTIFDPCPYGWRMPWGSDWTEFIGGMNDISTDFVKEPNSGGRLYNDDPNAFFPASGQRDNIAIAGLSGIGWGGFYWCGSSSETAYGCSMYFTPDRVFSPHEWFRPYGYSVRPVLDK